MRKVARTHGITTRYQYVARPQIHDPEWLRHRYVDRRETITGLADELGVSIPTVRNALDRAGITGRHNQHDHQDRHARIIELYTSGLPMADVANQIGCAPTTVSRVVARSGLRRQTPHPSELDDPVWLADRLVNRQQSLTSVAAELDVNRAAVTRARDRHGIKTTHARRSRPARRQLERRFRRLKSVAAIARSYDTSPDVAERWLAEIGIFTSTSRLRKADMRTALRATTTSTTAARRLGTTMHRFNIEMLRHNL